MRNMKRESIDRGNVENLANRFHAKFQTGLLNNTMKIVIIEIKQQINVPYKRSCWKRKRGEI